MADAMEDRFTPTERIKILEDKVEQLMSAVFTPAVLPTTPSTFSGESVEGGGAVRTELEGQVTIEEAVALVESELGGEDITSSTPPEQPDSVVFDLDKAEYAQRRMQCSERAQTPTPQPLTRNFRPSAVGYTAEMFKQDYPDLNPSEVIEQFFNFNLPRGERSNNWLEKFWQFARRAAEFAKEKQVEGWGETDSMGLPLDPIKRREMLGQREGTQPQ